MSCYLTKPNLNVWRTQEYLEGSGTNVPDWWSDVCRHTEPGDISFSGISGENVGIYAKATVISHPCWHTPDHEFYVNPEDIEEGLGADIDAGSFHNRVDRPILEARLNEIPQLRRVAKWLHVQGACSRLTDDECEALNALI